MKKTLRSLFLLTMIGAISVNAQESTKMTDTVHDIDEIIVSSVKKEELSMLSLDIPIKFLPMSTNTVSAPVLELRGISDIQDATKFMPGVRMSTSYGAFQTLTIRGFSNAPIMVDGIRDERTTVNSYPFMDLTSIESMELLKGPASVLYGFSAIGGVINIVRKAPIAEDNVFARLSYGSYDEKQATLGFGGKIAGPINYRANVNYSNGEGYRRTNDSRFSGYLALGGEIGDKGLLDVRGGFSDDFYGTDAGLPDLMPGDIYTTEGDEKIYSEDDMQEGIDPRNRYNNESDFMYNKSWNSSAQYTHRFNKNVKLMDKVSYNYDDINYFGTEALSYLESDEAIYDTYYMKNDEKKYICLDTVALTYPLRFSHIAKTVSNKLELSVNAQIGSIKNALVAGYSFMHMGRTSYSGYSLGTDVQGPGLYSHVSVKDPQSQGYMTTSMSKASIYDYNANGFYIQDLVSLSDKLKVMLAGRYDLFDYSYSSASTVDGKREYDESTLTDPNSIKNQAFTYRAGVVYVPTEGLSIFASMANFFKPIYSFYSATTIYIDKNGNEFIPEENGSVFDPESGYQAEGGVKYDLNDWLTFNASAFYILKENSTISLGTESVEGEDGEMIDMSVKGQVGRMSSKGFDVDFTMIPYRTLAITMGYSYTDAQIMEIATNPYMDSYSTAGKQQTGVPKNTAYALASYVVDRGPLQGLGVHADATYMDKVYRNSTNTSWYDNYWLMDAGVSYMVLNNIRMTLNVNNILNTSYYNQSVGDQMIPSLPRSYNLSLTYTL